MEAKPLVEAYPCDLVRMDSHRPRAESFNLVCVDGDGHDTAYEGTLRDCLRFAESLGATIVDDGAPRIKLINGAGIYVGGIYPSGHGHWLIAADNWFLGILD